MHERVLLVRKILKHGLGDGRWSSSCCRILSSSVTSLNFLFLFRHLDSFDALHSPPFACVSFNWPLSSFMISNRASSSGSSYAGTTLADDFESVTSSYAVAILKFNFRLNPHEGTAGVEAIESGSSLMTSASTMFSSELMFGIISGLFGGLVGFSCRNVENVLRFFLTSLSHSKLGSSRTSEEGAVSRSAARLRLDLVPPGFDTICLRLASSSTLPRDVRAGAVSSCFNVSVTFWVVSASFFVSVGRVSFSSGTGCSLSSTQLLSVAWLTASRFCFGRFNIERAFKVFVLFLGLISFAWLWETAELLCRDDVDDRKLRPMFSFRLRDSGFTSGVAERKVDGQKKLCLVKISTHQGLFRRMKDLRLIQECLKLLKLTEEHCC